MEETDDEFVKRMKSTKGSPSEADAARLRKILREESLEKIMKGGKKAS